MPLNNPAPQFGLLTAYDMRDYSGVKMFTRSGGAAVNMITFASGDGIFEDLIFLLNRRADDGNLTWSGAMDLVNTFGTSWVVGIDANDKITITSDVDFEIRSTGSVDALGIGTSAINATLVGSDYVVTAPNDWIRGELNLDDVSYTVEEVGGAGSFLFPSIKVYMQDVTTGLRNKSTINDADAFSTMPSISEIDRAANATQISWFLDSEGRVNCSYLTSIGHITWDSSDVRDLLGFTGDETPTTYATSYSLLTATHKAAGVLIPTRPYQQHHLRGENMGQARRLIGGGYVSNYIGTYITSILRFDLDALLDSTDDYQHFVNRWLPYCGSGERVNFYQGWGDSRRSLPTASVYAGQPAYDTLYTSEDNGAYGRIRGSLTTDKFDLVYPGRLRRRVPVSMEIEHL
ncbi:MAG: hypothetical protein ACO38Q_05300 [Aquiluna sp.]|jgi:hypothetical protein